MGTTWTYFLFNVASSIIYNPCALVCSKSTAKCMLDSVIAMICSGKSHMDEKIDINIFYIDNWFIKWIYSNLNSLFVSIVTVFIILLYFFIRLNELFIGLIVNDDWYNNNQSYYKIIYCYSFIFRALTLTIFWIKMLRLSIFESILFVEESLYTIYDANNLDQGNDETDSKIDTKVDFCDHCRLINCNLERYIGGISSICFIY